MRHRGCHVNASQQNEEESCLTRQCLVMESIQARTPNRGDGTVNVTKTLLQTRIISLIPVENSTDSSLS